MFVQGSTALCEFEISRAAGPVDLSGAIVYIMIKKDRNIPAYRKDCVIVDAPNGRCQLKLSPTDLDTSGTYNYIITIEYSQDEILKSAVNGFYVQEGLL